MRRRSSLSPTAVAIATCWVLCTGPAGAQIATLTRDIVPPGLSNGSSGPNQFVALGDRAVFIAAAPGLDAEALDQRRDGLGYRAAAPFTPQHLHLELRPRAPGA